MSSYIGDITAGKTIRTFFNTRDTDGVPITLGGSGAVSVYKDGGTTESTTGVTLSIDFDGHTGLHMLAVDTAADGTFYSAGSDFECVITTGTVDTISVVGLTVGKFSIANRSALRPTTADRTLDVSAGGEAGVDWANVGSPTTTVGLSGTTVSTSQAVASVAGAVGSVTGSVGSIAAGGIAAASFAANAINAAALAADAVTEIQNGLATAVAVADVPTVAEFEARTLPAADYFVVGDYTAPANSDIAAIKAQTDLIPAFPAAVGSAMTLAAGSITAAVIAAGAIDADALAADASTELATALLKFDLSTISGEAARSPINALRFLVNGFSVAGTTLTVFKEDGSTAAYTRTLTVDATADPITGVA